MYSQTVIVSRTIDAQGVMGYITALTFVFLNFDELWKMNRTLFDCGLRKSVELKDGRVYVITSTLEKTVKLSSATVKCKHCDRSFKVEQYLDSHVQFKHPASATQNSNSISSASRDTLTIFVNNNNHSGETNMHRMAESQQLEDVPRESGGVAKVKLKGVAIIEGEVTSESPTLSIS